jgi:hypothetical protein
MAGAEFAGRAGHPPFSQLKPGAVRLLRNAARRWLRLSGPAPLRDDGVARRPGCASCHYGIKAATVGAILQSLPAEAGTDASAVAYLATMQNQR